MACRFPSVEFGSTPAGRTSVLCAAIAETLFMASYQERLKILETRCSGFAVELLRDLQGHPKFPELVSNLEQIDGTLYRVDIEQAFYELIKQ
jgi:hypothetical protein